MKASLFILHLFTADFSFAQTASFIAPDTICTNSPIVFTNTSDPNRNFQWNFCTSRYDTIIQSNAYVRNGKWPQSSNYIEENGKYYGFLLEGQPVTTITRIDFGNSLSNTPTFTSLGNFGGMTDVLGGLQDIQVVKDNGAFFLFVGGYKNETFTNRNVLVRIDLGNSIENLSGTATDLSSIGSFQGPESMSFAKTNDGWFALIANRSFSGSIMLLNFGNDLRNKPIVTNYGNFNNTFYNPNSIAIVNDSNLWYALFISSANGRLYKLSFGNSFLNTPAIARVSTSGLDSLQGWKLAVAKDCNYTYCFVNPLTKEKIARLDFSSLSSDPVTTLLSPARFFPNQYKLSNIISDGTSAYFFVSKIDILIGTSGDSLIQFKFNGCNGAELPLFNGYNPPPVTFSKPGKYTVSLMQDKNLPTETLFCKDVVVIDGATGISKAVSLCVGDSARLRPSFKSANYYWSNGSADSFVIVKSAGTYWVKSSNLTCGVSTDSFSITINQVNAVSIAKSNDIDCSQPAVTLTASGAISYRWLPSPAIENITLNPQVLKPLITTTFGVVGIDANGCSSSASIRVNVDYTPGKNLYLVPNAITPNKDGLNDCFGVKYWGSVEQFSLTVFNRWGQLIFKTNSNNSCCSGNYKNGEPAESGTYAYQISCVTACAGPLKRSGIFQLIR